MNEINKLITKDIDRSEVIFNDVKEEYDKGKKYSYINGETRAFRIFKF